jgi:hypothetical protein
MLWAISMVLRLRRLFPDRLYTRNRMSPPSSIGIGSRFNMPSEMLIMASSDRKVKGLQPQLG